MRRRLPMARITNQMMRPKAMTAAMAVTYGYSKNAVND